MCLTVGKLDEEVYVQVIVFKSFGRHWEDKEENMRGFKHKGWHFSIKYMYSSDKHSSPISPFIR